MVIQPAPYAGRDAALPTAGLTARPLAVLVIVVMVFAAACGGRADDAGASSQQGSDVEADASRNASTQRIDDDRIEVTIAGPAFAGRHEVSGDMQCHSTAGIWQAMYETDRKSGLSTALVMLQGVPASGGTSEQVTLNLMFGQVEDDLDPNSGMVDLYARGLGGDARGTVTREGKGAVLTIEGTTPHAGRVTTVVRCASVDVID